jgi:hypothetical protein
MFHKSLLFFYLRQNPRIYIKQLISNVCMSYWSLFFSFHISFLEINVGILKKKSHKLKMVNLHIKKYVAYPSLYTVLERFHIAGDI